MINNFVSFQFRLYFITKYEVLAIRIIIKNLKIPMGNYIAENSKSNSGSKTVLYCFLIGDEIFKMG